MKRRVQKAFSHELAQVGPELETPVRFEQSKKDELTYAAREQRFETPRAVNRAACCQPPRGSEFV